MRPRRLPTGMRTRERRRRRVPALDVRTFNDRQLCAGCYRLELAQWAKGTGHNKDISKP